MQKVVKLKRFRPSEDLIQKSNFGASYYYDYYSNCYWKKILKKGEVYFSECVALSISIRLNDSTMIPQVYEW